VGTAGSEIRFAANPARRNLAVGAAAWLGVLALTAGAGWWRRRAEQ